MEVEVIVEKPIEHTKVEIHEVHHDVPVETVRVERVEVEVPIERQIVQEVVKEIPIV